VISASADAEAFFCGVIKNIFRNKSALSEKKSELPTATPGFPDAF
jgi:hypothetical protein